MKGFLVTALSLAILYIAMPILLSHMSWESAMRVVGLTLTLGGFVMAIVILPKYNEE